MSMNSRSTLWFGQNDPQNDYQLQPPAHPAPPAPAALPAHVDPNRPLSLYDFERASVLLDSARKKRVTPATLWHLYTLHIQRYQNQIENNINGVMSFLNALDRSPVQIQQLQVPQIQVQPPQVQVHQIPVPQVQIQHVQVPQYQVPQAQVSQVQVQQVQVQQVQVQQVQVQQVQVQQVQVQPTQVQQYIKAPKKATEKRKSYYEDTSQQISYLEYNRRIYPLPGYTHQDFLKLKREAEEAFEKRLEEEEKKKNDPGRRYLDENGNSNGHVKQY